MYRKRLAQKPERRDVSRQERLASSQDGPWRTGADGPPPPTGVAAGAENQDERDLEVGWLAVVGSNLRSFLGIAALVVFVLPAIILVLTVLGDDDKPVSMNTATARRGESAVSHQSRPQGSDQNEGGGGDRLAGRDDGSSGTGTEVVKPTQQPGGDRRGTHQEAQDATVGAAPATATAAAGSPEPVSSASASSASASASVAGGSVAPATSTASASPAASTGPPTAAQPASAPAGSAPPTAQQGTSPGGTSAPPLVQAMPTPNDVPTEGLQKGLPDASVYNPSQ